MADVQNHPAFVIAQTVQGLLDVAPNLSGHTPVTLWNHAVINRQHSELVLDHAWINSIISFDRTLDEWEEFIEEDAVPEVTKSLVKTTITGLRNGVQNIAGLDHSSFVRLLEGSMTVIAANMRDVETDVEWSKEQLTALRREAVQWKNKITRAKQMESRQKRLLLQALENLITAVDTYTQVGPSRFTDIVHRVYILFQVYYQPALETAKTVMQIQKMLPPGS